MNINNLKKNSFSITVTLLFLASLILLNIFTGMLTERFFLKVDLTESGLFTLSDRAASFLRDVNEPVDVIVLSEESAWLANNTFDMIGNILRNYSASSGGQLRIQYVNPDLNSFDGSKYNNSLSELKAAYTELENMSRNDIILLSSRRAKLIPIIELFAQTTDQFGRPLLLGVRADQELISGLIYVLNEQIARIVFINNHGEDTMLMFNAIFERTGYTSSTINLALEEIPDDTVVLVSAAPKFDFLSDEIVKIEDFMSLGGNMIFLHDVEFLNMPMVDNFLAEWGVTMENKLIFDEVNVFIQHLGVIGAHVVEGELPSTVNAEIISTNFAPVGVFFPRPLSSEGTRGGFRMLPLIQTFSATSYAKDLSEGSISTQERESGDESGPFTIAYNVRRLTRNADGDQVHANLIVAGVSMFEDTFLALYGDSFYNNLLISDIASDLNPFSDRVFFPVKEISDSQMLVSAGGTRMILIVTVILLPLAIITTGVVVWRKRRHK